MHLSVSTSNFAQVACGLNDRRSWICGFRRCAVTKTVAQAGQIRNGGRPQTYSNSCCHSADETRKREREWARKANQLPTVFCMSLSKADSYVNWIDAPGDFRRFRLRLKELGSEPDSHRSSPLALAGVTLENAQGVNRVTAESQTLISGRRN